MFGLFYFDWTLLIVLPAFFFSLWAQFKVNSTFEKYSKQRTRRGITGADAARRVLNENGLYDIRIEHISGKLTDHYDPRAKVIRLSDSVYNSDSAAAVGVACHEAGHAVQHAKGYFPIKIRSAVVPATRFGSMLSIPLFMIGLIFASDALMLGGILLYTVVAFFQLVTLPVEFNASNRAMAAIKNAGFLSPDEYSSSRKVLTAAAMTYVAALATSLLTLLRLLVLANGRGNRR
jgi:Zn-dependent membrane protease YugP